MDPKGLDWSGLDILFVSETPPCLENAWDALETLVGSDTVLGAGVLGMPNQTRSLASWKW